MGKAVLKKGLVLFGGYDLTPDINAPALQAGADALECTGLNDDTHVYTPGLQKVKVSVKGFYNVLTDAPINANLGSSDVLTLAASQVEGNPASFLKAMPAQYVIGAQAGKLFPMSLTGETTDRLIIGTLMARQAALSASGHGSPFQLGAVSALQAVYAALHVTNITGSGVSITVVLESNADNTFGSPTTRISFAAVTDVTGVLAQCLSAAGAITDTWWRLKWTISGTGSFDITAAAGILLAH